MKKVAFLCCLFYGLITQAIGATYNCRPQSLGPLAFKSSNEYLFLGESNYDNKIALVCGYKGTNGCEHGTMVLVYTWVYYRGRTEFNGNGLRVYMCDTSGGSSWAEIFIPGLDECSGEPKKKDTYTFKDLETDDFYVLVSIPANNVGDEPSGYWIVQDLCKVAKKGSTPSDDPSPATSEEKKTDTTKASETTSEQDTKQKQSGDAGKKSEKKPAQGAKQNQSAQNQSGDAEKKSKEKSGQGAKQNQSGDAGENAEDKWLEPCSQEDLLKVPHAKAGRYIYRTKDEIVCAATACEAGYYLVRNAEGQSQGWCKYGTDPYATTNASEIKPAQGASSSDASGTGATGADATGAGTSAQKQSIDTGTSLTQSQTSRVRALTQKIKNAASQLDSISSNFKVSGWKDAEGKFNTARLASD